MEMYLSRDFVVMFDRAARAGELAVPTYKRASPHAFAIIEKGYRAETSYGGVSPMHEVRAGFARVFRKD